MIPETWESLKIGDLISFSGGSQPPRSTFVYEPQDGYVRFIQTRDFKSNDHLTYIKKTLARKFCNADDVMIGRYGPPVFQIFRGISGAYNVALIKASPKSDKISRDYIYYYLSLPILFRDIDALSRRSAGQSGVDMKFLRSYPLPLPPKKEMESIVSVIRRCEHQQELTESLLSRIKKRRQGLIQQLLTGKLRLPKFTKSNEFIDTKYGQLPFDWSYPTIGDLAFQQSKKNDDGATRPVLSCTKYRGLVDSLSYFGKQIFSDDLSTYKVVKRHQFAYATNHMDEGSIGYQDIHDEAVISPMYTVFQTKSGVISDRFLYLLFKTEWYRHIFAANTNASVDRRGGLRWDDFSEIRVPLPSLDEQEAILRVAETADREIDTLERLLAAYRTQKKGLMQQLLTGKCRVPSAQVTPSSPMPAAVHHPGITP